MDNCKISIAIIEPSDVVYEGLSNLILRTNKHFYFYRLNELDDLSRTYGDTNFNMVIVNPITLQNKINEFHKLKRHQPNLLWIGLVYAFFDTLLLSFFDDIILVTDPIHLVAKKLNAISDKCSCQISVQEQLSERENEILVHLVKGFSHKEIADLLNISIHTVTSHRKNIIEKTGIKSLSGLTIYAISKKIITLDSLSPENTSN